MCYEYLCIVWVCVGEGNGEQAQWDDGQGEGVHPRVTDQLYGAHRNAHL